MLEDFFNTKYAKWFLWGFGGAIAAALIFHAGVVTGEHGPMCHFGPGSRADGPLAGFMPREAFIEGHGAIGQIATVTLPTFTLTTRGGVNQLVDISSSTKYIGGANNASSDLKPGVMVLVIGDPTQTEDDLDARVIKFLPAPPAGMPATGMGVQVLYVAH